MLGELGRRFVEDGAAEVAGDIYWLVEDEVSELAARLERGERLSDLGERIPRRKAEWRARLKSVPPGVVPAASTWGKLLPWAREAESSATLKGVGASAGTVTAPARVLFGPEDFAKLKPGDVLVAVTTTPAWTPLFQQVLPARVVELEPRARRRWARRRGTAAEGPPGS